MLPIILQYKQYNTSHIDRNTVNKLINQRKEDTIAHTHTYINILYQLIYFSLSSSSVLYSSVTGSILQWLSNKIFFKGQVFLDFSDKNVVWDHSLTNKKWIHHRGQCYNVASEELDFYSILSVLIVNFGNTYESNRVFVRKEWVSVISNLKILYRYIYIHSKSVTVRYVICQFCEN